MLDLDLNDPVELLLTHLRRWQPPKPFVRKERFVKVSESNGYIVFEINLIYRDRTYYVAYKDARCIIEDHMTRKPKVLLEQVTNGLTYKARELLST